MKNQRQRRQIKWGKKQTKRQKRRRNRKIKKERKQKAFRKIQKKKEEFQENLQHCLAINRRPNTVCTRYQRTNFCRFHSPTVSYPIDDTV